MAFSWWFGTRPLPDPDCHSPTPLDYPQVTYLPFTTLTTLNATIHLAQNPFVTQTVIQHGVSKQARIASHRTASHASPNDHHHHHHLISLLSFLPYLPTLRDPQLIYTIASLASPLWIYTPLAFQSVAWPPPPLSNASFILSRLVLSLVSRSPPSLSKMPVARTGAG